METLADLKHLILLPAVVAWFALGSRRPGWSRWLGLQVCVAVVCEAVGWATSRMGLNNALLYNAYMLLEFALLSAVLVAVGNGSERVKREVWIGAALFAVAFALEGLADGLRAQFLTNVLLIGGFLLAVQAGAGLYRLTETSTEPLYRRPEFWALLSLVLYFLGIAPVFGLYNYLSEHNKDLAHTVYSINDVLFVLRYGLVAWSFVLARRQTRMRT